MEQLPPGTQLEVGELRIPGASSDDVIAVERELGAAPHGTWYRGRVADTEVLLTLLDPDMLRVPSVRDLLLRNVARGSTVHHKNLLEPFGVGWYGPTRFIAEASPGGKSVRSYILKRIAKGKSIDLKTAYTLVAHVCNAVGALNQVVPHGFLTSDTVYVTSSGRVMVGCVGIGATLTASPGFRRFQTAGLLACLTPEHLATPPQLLLATDTFGVATLLVELLSGSAVFQAGQDLRELDLRVPEPVLSVLQRSIAGDPAIRPTNVLAFKSELAQALDSPGVAPGQSAPAPPPPLGPPPPGLGPTPAYLPPDGRFAPRYPTPHGGPMPPMMHPAGHATPGGPMPPISPGASPPGPTPGFSGPPPPPLGRTGGPPPRPASPPAGPPPPPLAPASRPPPPPPAPAPSGLGLELKKYDQALARLSTLDGESGLRGLSGLGPDDAPPAPPVEPTAAGSGETYFGSFADGDDPAAASGNHHLGGLDRPEVTQAQRRAGQRFVINRDGVDRGPFPIDELIVLIRQGQLESVDHIRDERAPDPILVVDIPELRAACEEKLRRAQPAGSQAIPTADRQPAGAVAPAAETQRSTAYTLMLILVILGGFASAAWVIWQRSGGGG